MSNERHLKNLRIYEAISHEVAMDASERGEGLTPAERAEARQFVASMREHVLEKRRADRAASRTGRVRPSIIAMARDALERGLAELRPSVLAFRDLSELSDDDLRTALEDAMQLAERMS